MSPTKSGARSKKHSFPRAQRLTPAIRKQCRSTLFRLNSFTVHSSHWPTWLSDQCLGSGHRGGRGVTSKTVFLSVIPVYSLTIWFICRCVCRYVGYLTVTLYSVGSIQYFCQGPKHRARGWNSHKIKCILFVLFMINCASFMKMHYLWSNTVHPVLNLK